MPDTKYDVVEYWNGRAHLGDMAGTDDVIAKQIEMQTLAKHIGALNLPEGALIVDAGCGNGLTLAYLANTFPQYRYQGFDNSPEMVQAAHEYTNTECPDADVCIHEDSVLTWEPKEPVACVYTERTLINLPDEETQGEAIGHLWKCGGVYLMMENFVEPLERLNVMRGMLGLSEIVPPWHNRYMSEEWVYENVFSTFQDDVDYYSSEYYYLSRVVNAWTASLNGEEPDYESDINRLALAEHGKLGIHPNLGQGILFVLRGFSDA